MWFFESKCMCWGYAKWVSVIFGLCHKSQRLYHSWPCSLTFLLALPRLLASHKGSPVSCPWAFSPLQTCCYLVPKSYPTLCDTLPLIPIKVKMYSKISILNTTNIISSLSSLAASEESLSLEMIIPFKTIAGWSLPTRLAWCYFESQTQATVEMCQAGSLLAHTPVLCLQTHKHPRKWQLPSIIFMHSCSK